MKRYYILFTLSIVAIISIQSFYVESLYRNYIDSEQKYIDDCIHQAIGLEFYSRGAGNRGKVVFQSSIISLNDMSQNMLDSILAIHPFPTKSTLKTTKKNPEYDIIDLINKGVIKSASEIRDHRTQDERYQNGNPINIQILDSLLDLRINRGYTNSIEITNSTDSLLSVIGELENFNYKSKRIQIGFNGYQFITVCAQIPLSEFIKQSIWVLILSLLIVIIPLISLLYLLTTVRQKQQELEQREQSANGIIHDLKSPLGSIATMLSLFKITETDPQKRNLIRVNAVAITHLIKKVELLLEASRCTKARVIVCKEPITTDELIERVALTKDTLLLSYQGKKQCTITIDNHIPANNVLYIDAAHVDTILNNLIDNAIKYANDGVEIHVSLDIDSQNNLLISVADNGFGIASEHLKLIFKQFYRIPNKGIKGYGIGLSYLRAIAIAHGGDVNVQSILGEGSKFEVRLNSNNND